MLEGLCFCFRRFWGEPCGGGGGGGNGRIAGFEEQNKSQIFTCFSYYYSSVLLIHTLNLLEKVLKRQNVYSLLIVQCTVVHSIYIYSLYMNEVI